MGSVWLAEHVELGTRVAVKLMDPNVAMSAEGLGRFKREAQAAASLDCPNIVRVFDYGVDAETPYIAMELLRGESLAQRLKRLGRIDPTSLATIFLQVGKAITKAHDLGIVHRDLKPDNIFLVLDDGTDLAKVIDFGIAKRTSTFPGQASGIETRTGALLGTPFYMSPEQASGSKLVDYRTDIWSLGVIAYECITGKRPYESDSFGGLVLQICTSEPRVPSREGPVPEGFDQWYARCASRTPAGRYASALETTSSLCALCVPASNVAGDHPKSAPCKLVDRSAVASATSPRTEGVGRTHWSPSDQAGAVAVTIPGIKKSPRKRYVAALVGLASLTLVGTIAGLGSRMQAELSTSSAEVHPSAAIDHSKIPGSVAQDAVAPTPVSPSVVASATVAPVAGKPSLEQPRPAIAKSHTVVPPRPVVPQPMAAKMAKSAASFTTNVGPTERPPPVATPDNPTNPFGTRE